jgi:hypothetical protein
VLHVDETEVKLLNGTGYVWVFANLEATVYIYRPSREGNFLRKMLADFNGVLVSDFYAAYDGLNCLQQRCLIHLMRDMNRAILDNPFDQELQSITTPFGALLRSIVVTIDEHGLKRRHLERHSRAVATFFKAVTDHFYESDASKPCRTACSEIAIAYSSFFITTGCPGITTSPKTPSSDLVTIEMTWEERSRKQGSPNTWCCSVSIRRAE